MKSANKRILAAIPFVVLVFSMALSFSGCGSSAGNETPAPEAAKTATSEPTPARDFKITGMTCDDKGYVTVTWRDSEDAAPYRVACRYRVSDDPDNTRQLNELFFNGTKDVEGYECTVSRLIPGEPYWVYIYDKNDVCTEAYSYQPEKCADFTDFGIKVSGSLEVGEGKDPETQARDITNIEAVDSFSAAEIELWSRKYTHAGRSPKDGLPSSASPDAAQEEPFKQYGINLKIYTDPVSAKYDAFIRISIKAPNSIGPINDVFSEKAYFDSDIPYLEWDFFTLNNYFGTIYSQLGKIPTGEYTLNVYIKNYYAGSYTFMVTD